jgi:multiple sugar transport system ATP-binding protein
MGKILLKNLVKEWKNFTAVNNIFLEIKKSEFFVLLGPSGCGKTTTLRMIAGLEEATSGEIYIGDKLVNELTPKDRNIAMVFQNYGLYPHMNVKENIAYPLKMRKIPKAEHEQAILQAAKKVKIEELLEKKPSQLSGGQRQRVALARAIVRKPNCFLMDEPLSNLDAKLRVSTRAEIKLLQNDLKITTVYVTHDQIEAMTMADRVAIMNQGSIVQVGTPTEIYNSPENVFVAGFIGSPPMNLLKGFVQKGCFQKESFQIKNLKLPDQEIYLGFRAEDIDIIKEKSKAQCKAKIYNLELLGDSVMLDIRIGSDKIFVKKDKNFAGKIGDEVAIATPLEKCHFFDARSGVALKTK